MTKPNNKHDWVHIIGFIENIVNEELQCAFK